MAAPARADARGAPPETNDRTAPRRQRHRSFVPAIKSPRWLHPVVIAASCIPVAYVLGALAAAYFYNSRILGSNPIKEAEHMTGEWTLRFLMFALAITPALRLTKWGWLVRFRRTFGLVAFSYACVHLTIYSVLDVELSWGDLITDIMKRPYITIGMTALLLMTPLAITSTKGWIKRMGGAKWNALHRLIYVIVVLGTIHFWMAVKKDIEDPLIFAGIFAALLGYRAIAGLGRRQRAPSRR
jgi:sulfoxide reductase heme-binding subunit YedZ